MSKYEVTLTAPGFVKHTVEAASLTWVDDKVVFTDKPGLVVAAFPRERVVSVVRLDVDPLEKELKDARETLQSQMRLTAKYFHEIEDLRKAAKPAFTIYKRQWFRKPKWVATFDARAGVRFSSNPNYTFDLSVGEEQA